MKITLKMRLSYSVFAIFFLSLLTAASGVAQTAQVFRLDGGNSTYAFGVNEHGELQPLYWGGRLGRARFDSSRAFVPGDGFL